jgi:hypothetical protein
MATIYKYKLRLVFIPFSAQKSLHSAEAHEQSPFQDFVHFTRVSGQIPLPDFPFLPDFPRFSPPSPSSIRFSGRSLLGASLSVRGSVAVLVRIPGAS